MKTHVVIVSKAGNVIGTPEFETAKGAKAFIKGLSKQHRGFYQTELLTIEEFKRRNGGAS